MEIRGLGIRRANPLVRSRPPGRLLAPGANAGDAVNAASQGAGRGPGGPPYIITRRNLAAAVLVRTTACKRRRKPRVQATDEEGGGLAAVLQTSDPRTSAQLLKGFYDVEQTWRWTMQKFSVALRPPRGAAQKGALLKVKFAVPDAVISRLKAVSLSAKLGGVTLPPETYTQAGAFEYARDVDAKLLAGEVVNVDFELDKALPPGEVDQRELGVIVSTIGFEAK